MSSKENPAVQIGLLCLPVMACILAAVLFDIVLNAERNTPVLNEKLDSLEPQVEAVEVKAKETRDNVHRNLAMLRRARALLRNNSRLEVTVREARQEIRKLENALAKKKQKKQLLDEKQALQLKIRAIVLDKEKLGTLQRELQHLQNQIKSLNKEAARLENHVDVQKQKNAILAEVKNLSDEIARLKEEIAALDNKQEAIRNRVELPGLEEFPRPYVSIEYKNNRMTVYFPNQKPTNIIPPLSAQQENNIKDNLKQIPAIVIFVRESGFKTYKNMLIGKSDLLSDIFFHKLDFDVEWTVTPIRDFENISAYLLLGKGQ